MIRTLKNTLYEQIKEILDCSISERENVYNAFRKRLEENALTRDENPKTHFCAYFLPYNPKDKKIFIVHHKKSGLWLSPGGHIDEGEGLLTALNREINEELGMSECFNEPQIPFLLTITPIQHPTQPCREHYDIWYLVETDGGNFNIDPREFHHTRWMMIEEARKIVIDPANLKALEVIEGMR